MRWTLLILLSLATAAAAALAAVEPATTRAADDDIDFKVVPLKIEPTLLKASVKDASAQKLFDTIGENSQTRVLVRPDALDHPAVAGATYSAIFDGEPFWNCISDACESTGLTPTTSGDSRESDALVITRGGPWKDVSVDGATAVRVTGITRSASFDYTTMRKGDEQVRVRLEVWPEPKTRRWSYLIAPRGSVGFDDEKSASAVARTALVDEASDESGHSLLPKSQPMQTDGSALHFTGEAAHQATLTLAYPPGAGRKIALLRGHLALRVPKEIVEVSIANPAAHDGAKLSRLRNDMTFFALKNRAEPMRYTFELHAARKDDSDDRWAAIRQSLGRLQAVTKMIKSDGSEASSGRGGASEDGKEAWQGFDCDAPEKLTLLKISFPQEMQTVEVKFEFKDLTLP
jgi:hypothetical protein